MNIKRRRRIIAIEKILIEAAQELQSLAEDEQEALDNMPQSLQYSEGGEAMQENISNLENIMNEVECQAGELNSYFLQA